MKNLSCLLLLLLASVGIQAQPRILFPRFPMPNKMYCYGDSSVVALHSGDIGLYLDFGRLHHTPSLVRYSSDAGKSWYRSTPIPYALSTTPESPVCFLDSITIIAQAILQVESPQSVRGVLIRSTDGGQQWSEVLETKAIGPMTFTGKNLGSFCNGDTVFWTTTNGGQTWRECSVPRINPLEPNSYAEVLPLDSNRWLILTYSTKSTIGYVKYRFRATPDRIEEPPTQFFSINGTKDWTSDIMTFSSPQPGTLVTTGIQVNYRSSPELDDVQPWIETSTTAGKSWTHYTVPRRPSSKALRYRMWHYIRTEMQWFNDSVGIVAADVILRTTNAGRTWSLFNARGAVLASCSPTGFGIARGQEWYGGKETDPDSMQSILYVTHDFGQTWSTHMEVQGPRSYAYDEIIATPRHDRIYARHGDMLYRSEDHGVSWTAQAIHLAAVPEAYSAMKNDHPLFLLGEQGRLHLGCYGYSDDGGRTWTRPRASPLHLQSAAPCIRGRGNRLIHALVRNNVLYWACSTDQGERWEIQDSLVITGTSAFLIARLAIRSEDSVISCLVTDMASGKEWYRVRSEWPYSRWVSQRIATPPVADSQWNSLWVQSSVSVNGETIVLLHVKRDTLNISHDFGSSWKQVVYSKDAETGILQTYRLCNFLALNNGAILYGDRSGFRVSRDDGSTWPLLRPIHFGGEPAELIVDGDSGIWIIGASGTRGFPDPLFLFLSSESILLSTSNLHSAPSSFTLPPAWPNPVPPGGAVHLPYALTAPSEVTILVRDLLGRIVARLEQGRRDPGHHEALWQPRGLAPGLYLTQVHAGPDRVAMGKVVVR